ncbi:hypothetical protein NX862_08965 [Rhodobacter sp. KR11]|uniref:hypothetical protein n=1 Tax=Rhodobacter sp. KR11 TaxID=2974588 RepID=UPI002222125E|nr:hypothetical protein [Rhodobacter sp. KR11]MCW1918885.1 hypothetical protein [Rhodobacter sp. KR11]
MGLKMRLYFYLKPLGRQRLARGENTMPARVIAAVQGAGWHVTICPEAERPDIPHRDGFHMVVNNDPDGPRCLTLRPAGFEPFWQIQPTNCRWDWQTATLPYTPPQVPQDRIDAFLANWRSHILHSIAPSRAGHILAPLQGKLTETRSFQSASPLVMLRETLRRWPDRPVIATTHPSETYTPDETEALTALTHTYPRLSLQPGSTALLASADLVVTQNSTVAFKGFLLDKPAMLWARIDWHHMAASVPRDGVAPAFAQALAATKAPQDFGRYLFWYLRQQSLCAWEDKPKAILARLATLGWPISAT